MKDESRLLRAATKLDKDALIVVFDTYAPAIYNYALRLCGDPAESDKIVGNVFTQLLEKVTADKGIPVNLRSYLYQVAYHFVNKQICRTPYLASLETGKRSPNEIPPGSMQTPVAETTAMERFRSAFNNALSDLQRHVIILRFLEDFSADETAMIIGTTVNQVKAVQNLGLAILKSHSDSFSESKE